VKRKMEVGVLVFFSVPDENAEDFYELLHEWVSSEKFEATGAEVKDLKAPLVVQ